MKTTRTYIKGCDWCNATGTVPTYYGYDSCPVCNGLKTITVTEIIETEPIPIKAES
jgi:DnaJ-class molecular chaperone